jgi:hypothetical protein
VLIWEHDLDHVVNIHAVSIRWVHLQVIFSFLYYVVD